METKEKQHQKRKMLCVSLKQELEKLGEEVKPEFQFLKKRKFRFDYALPILKIAVEVNGGQFVNGRHNRGGKGYESDLEKLNLAQLNGWTVLQFTYQQLQKGLHISYIEYIKKTKENEK